MADTKQNTEIRVGIFLLVGMAVLGILVFQFGKLGGGSAESYSITAMVRDATGILKGAPVRLGGVDIGFVGSEPRLSDSFAELELDLRIHSDQKIPRGSDVRIGTSGLMGDSFIRVIPPLSPAEGFHEPGDRIHVSGPSSVDDLATDAVDTLVEAGEVLRELGGSVRQLNETFTRLDDSLLSESNVDNLSSVLVSLKSSSERIERASERLVPVLNETEQAAKDVQMTARAATGLVGEIEEEISGLSGSVGDLSPVLTEFDTTLDDLRETLQAANELMGKIESGGGLASALLHDPQLRDDLSSFSYKLYRSGPLFYPREREKRSEPRVQGHSATNSSEAEKKGLFPWMKKKP
jgi:phospholipid/cholesterol/gamma-HCH transport system substrate-binding protein